MARLTLTFVLQCFMFGTVVPDAHFDAMSWFNGSWPIQASSKTNKLITTAQKNTENNTQVNGSSMESELMQQNRTSQRVSDKQNNSSMDAPVRGIMMRSANSTANFTRSSTVKWRVNGTKRHHNGTNRRRKEESKPLGVIVLVVLAIAVFLIVCVYWSDGPRSSLCHRHQERIPSDSTIAANLGKQQGHPLRYLSKKSSAGDKGETSEK